ncbi:unnamed protein product [Heterobilharzia americana]|nr:unnamed protein product [Heterobilharzia americana]CAH8479500.1 unnamed protein product [Heterobilharzia americana]
MERSYSPEESDEFSVIDFSNDESRENGRSSSISQISPSLTSRSDNAMIGPEQSGREALKSAIVSFEEHTQTEENLLKDIKNICSRAKSLESKLRNKKSLLINQFQNVVSNLDREN